MLTMNFNAQKLYIMHARMQDKLLWNGHILKVFDSCSVNPRRKYLTLGGIHNISYTYLLENKRD